MKTPRISHLLGVVRNTKSLAEMEGVRRQLAHQQELVGEVYTAMEARVTELARAEGITPAKWWGRR